MRIRLLQSLLFASLAGAGCAGTGTVGYSAHATVSTPDLVYVSPGVQVIADYDEPVFYSNNYYWRYNSGVWYRSPYHTRGWVRVNDVPAPIRRIDRPTAYIHYRGNNRTVIRDHRQPTSPGRDNRFDADRQRQIERQRLIDQRERERQQDRRELIQDRQEQQERKQERVQERREVIQDRREDQRAAERQRLIDQRERQRQAERRRLLEQREREQRARDNR